MRFRFSTGGPTNTAENLGCTCVSQKRSAKRSRRPAADFPVSLRYSPEEHGQGLAGRALPGEEFEEKGRDIEEGIQAAKLLEEYGYDALDVDAGAYDAWWWNHPPMYMEKAPYRKFAKIVRDNVNIPVLMAGRVDNPDTALECVEDGICDIVGLGRPLLADPDIVTKIRTGKARPRPPASTARKAAWAGSRNIR